MKPIRTLLLLAASLLWSGSVSAQPTSPTPTPSLEFFGLQMLAPRAEIEALLKAKGIDWKETAYRRLQITATPELEPKIPAAEIVHVVFDSKSRLVLVDLRWPIHPDQLNPFRQLLTVNSAKYGPAKRTGTKDYWWQVKDSKMIVRLYENLRKTQGKEPALETALRILVQGADVASGADRLD